MIGAYAVGKKAAKFGFKRFGIPGAVIGGGMALAGYVVVRRALRSATRSHNVDRAINAGAIEQNVDEGGMGAVTDRETLDAAIDRDQVDEDVDMDEVEEEAERFSADEERTDDEEPSG